MNDRKILVLLSSIVVVLLIFSYGGNYAWSAAVEKNKTLPSSVTVGNTDISDMDREKASELLKAEVAGWKESGDIHLETGSSSVVIPASYVTFETEATLENVSGNGEYGWTVSLAADFEQEIRENLSPKIRDHFQMDRFTEQVKLEASRLPEERLIFNAYAFVPEHTEELYEEVATYSISIDGSPEIGNIINRIGEWRVPGKSTVSLLERVGETAEALEKEALNQASTAIYGSLLETPFVTEERHISLRLPDYADAGKEAAVDVSGEEDLRFRNTTSMDYFVELTLNGSNLLATWTGYPLTEKGRVVVSNAEEVEPRKTIRYSTSVTPGTENVLEEGEVGRVVEVYREETGDEERELVSEDYYPPVDTVVERYPVQDSTGENSTGAPEDSTDNQSDSPGETDTESEQPSSETDAEDSGDSPQASEESSDSGSSTAENENDEEQDGTGSDGSEGEGNAEDPPLWEPGNDKK
ncbi:VanW family protein [Salimicrobium flavidum]|uniref:Vancomycin resistance protein YoaR, contains peptidoglycan-binding and VanW domains n=1 Tax=Salimicrobium flavidum TaxID=570947 RepID=A0A1N7JN11_9BACI|nr:VanW family protein [Salimicrobium flavidum]SIS50697.1 Vancomycin resistance protein YoaR, contains peptidoglycan-binding and VanW domains [Salimicrobium flavidum]